jgi:hypothetical protein
VVLPDADEVDAQPVGEHRLLDHVADDIGLVQAPTIRVDRAVAERVEPELNIACPSGRRTHMVARTSI